MEALPVVPDLQAAEDLARQAQADSQACWSCGTCDAACPVFLATERLRPRKSVHMANLGLVDELLSQPQPWYCLGCRRCHLGCPNRVKPFELHRFLRHRAVAAGKVAPTIEAAYADLRLRFGRVRWHAAAWCMNRPLEELDAATWYRWLNRPLRAAAWRPIDAGPAGSGDGLENGRGCMTCSECSNCCPIYGEREVFDPQALIRKVNLGLVDQVVHSPSIWLCLGCQRCAEACSQKVRGYDIIAALQRRALEQQVVPADFIHRLMTADRLIYPRYLDEIDALLGLHGLSPQNGKGLARPAHPCR